MNKLKIKTDDDVLKLIIGAVFNCFSNGNDSFDSVFKTIKYNLSNLSNHTDKCNCEICLELLTIK